MKAWITFILCIALLTGFAMAEEQSVGCPQAVETQRISVQEIEGMNEEVVETLYVSDDGYEIWYPSEYLEAGENYGHDCFRPIGAGAENETYFMIVPSEVSAAHAEGLLDEAVGGFGPESEVGEPRWSTTADGFLLGAVDAKTESEMFRFYLVTNDKAVLLITACFPHEAAEGFGVRFDRMAESIAFSGVQLSGRYEGDGFAIAYPEELLEPDQVYSHEGFVPVEARENEGVYMLITESDVSPENADALLDEAGAGYQGVYAAEKREEIQIAGGLRLSSVALEQGGDYNRFYLIKGEDTVYCITATYNVAHEFDYGVYFDAMAESFELLENK